MLGIRRGPFPSPARRVASSGKNLQAFFRRIQRGEKAGFPRFKGRNRYRSFTYAQYGNGAVVDGGVLSLSKIGRISIRLHRPIEGTPKTVAIRREADGWYVCFARADAPIQPLPERLGRRRALTWGWSRSLLLPTARPFSIPATIAGGEAYLRRCQRRVARRKKVSHRRCEGGETLLAKAHQHMRQPAARLPSPGSGEAFARLRQHCLRRLADGQYAQEPPSR